MDPFPELEIKLCQKILSTTKISSLLLIDQEDILQEVMLYLLENQEEWIKIRKRSTSTTLMYTALRNRVYKIIDKNFTSSDLNRHSTKNVHQLIERDIRLERDRVWDTFIELKENEKAFVQSFYNSKNTLTRKELKIKCRLTETQAARASRRILRSARIELSYSTMYHQGELNEE